MALSRTSSTPSLFDSDIESVGSLQYVDIEELDEVEYALPTSEQPTLAEVLSTDETNDDEGESLRESKEPATCSALQVDFLQAISQQLLQAQERSSAGAATALSVTAYGRYTVGTAHGHLLSFHEQTLRWVCTENGDCGAVSCLSYNKDSSRLLVGYARGLVYQYDSILGCVLRRVTLGGETWGVLRVTWAGTAGLALDTGGSVWVIKFLRPLGVRSARVSCFFSGARGEVVAMTAQHDRILALATLTRVIIVAGGKAAGVRFDGPPDTLPVLEWCEADSRLLVCARANTMQWLYVELKGSSMSLRPVKSVQLKATPVWLGWLGSNLAIIDSQENLRLWNEDYDKPYDLSQIEPVYSSAFYKGLWTDGKVSQAMGRAGESALGGACVSEGALCVLGRRGILRIKPRESIARARAFFACGRYLQALRLLYTAKGSEAQSVARDFITYFIDSPNIQSNKDVAVQTIKLCLKYNLSGELYTNLWESCAGERAFVEALGEAAVRGELTNPSPSPDFTQELIERLAEHEPELVERVVASLPLTSLDPHRASVFTRERGLWRGVGAIAAALDGCSGGMRELVSHVAAEGTRCAGGGGCSAGGCAGGALLLAAADALAGRGAGGRALPDHARPSARHDALHALLDESGDSKCPLRVLIQHDTSATIRLLEQSSRDPPFAGPLGKQNRLRVARALLSYTPDVQECERRIEILEFITGQLSSGALPLDEELMKGVEELAAGTAGERADRAWLAVAQRVRARGRPLDPLRAAVPRARVLWRLDVMLDRHDLALDEFFDIDRPSAADLEEFFEYLRSRLDTDDETKNKLSTHLPVLAELSPRATATVVADHYVDSIPSLLRALKANVLLEFGESLLDMGRLRGDGTAIYLRQLCESRPADVKTFLQRNAGTIRPEDALSIIREKGPEAAMPICLEATGDHSSALDSMLHLLSLESNEEERSTLISEACDLCVRVGPTVPPTSAAAMWTKLLRSIGEIPPSLLFEAVAYLPVEELLERSCNSTQVARRMLAGGASGAAVWRSAVRVCEREAHEGLARALAAARRGLAVRGRCVCCDRPLEARNMVRTTHCARALHAGCDTPPTCVVCEQRPPDAPLTLQKRRAPPPSPSAPPFDCALLLAAPPRPDLDGLV